MQVEAKNKKTNNVSEDKMLTLRDKGKKLTKLMAKTIKKVKKRREIIPAQLMREAIIKYCKELLAEK